MLQIFNSLSYFHILKFEVPIPLSDRRNGTKNPAFDGKHDDLNERWRAGRPPQPPPENEFVEA